jgi:hypothetical protein
MHVSDYPYVWRWRAKHGDRYGERCAVWARGRMNSVGVEFRDGFRTVTSAYAVSRAARNRRRDARRDRRYDGA